ncbi:MAG TPA: MBL fold metallo-hydrolase [Acidobacteriota bacterium]|nr:MBL fold metallo-hydrolase [Acidobacteriota bacterium]
MKSIIGAVAILVLSVLAAQAQNLEIYFIDVEGGGATLIITPERESILVDTGWRRDDGRDARRILSVLQEQAKLNQIDFLITTHFHRDHYGSTLKLSEMTPIRAFLDHGPMAGLAEDPQFHMLYTEYMRANRGTRQTLRAGEEIPLKKGRVPLTITCVAARGSVWQASGSANPECANLKPNKKIVMDENAASIALLLKYGSFDFFHGADLTWNIEGVLVCPNNRIGRVDAMLVNHHGLKISNNPVLLASLAPTVTIMANGEKKGGDPEVIARLRSLPGLKASYQLHKILKNKPEDNSPDEFIANLTPEAECAGHWLRLSVAPSASTFEVTNSRTGVTLSYPIQ